MAIQPCRGGQELLHLSNLSFGRERLLLHLSNLSFGRERLLHHLSKPSFGSPASKFGFTTGLRVCVYVAAIYIDTTRKWWQSGIRRKGNEVRCSREIVAAFNQGL